MGFLEIGVLFVSCLEELRLLFDTGSPRTTWKQLAKPPQEPADSSQDDDDPERVPYRFSFRRDGDQPDGALDIVSDLYHSLLKTGLKSTEDLITLSYQPLAVFRVRAVTRCSSAISGHTQSILSMQSCPGTSSRFVSGSGDGTARIWDTDTGTPYRTLKGHTSWVLAANWSPEGKYIATGSYDNTVRIWNPQDGEPLGGPLKGHTKWITSLAWEPYHLQTPSRPRVASASKDATIRIWDVIRGQVDMTLTRHTASVTCMKWGGTGNIYTASLDKTVKIWDAHNGTLIHNLTSHVHRVNYLALSTDFVLRTAYHDHMGDIPPTEEAKRARALSRYQSASRHSNETVERIATCSDDNKIYLWASPTAKPTRLDGHQKQVNHVAFSPDGHYLASCGFDNHVILWNAETGGFIKKLIGHVGAVYQCCFSADSRLLVSASKDTTLKAWDVRTGKLKEDLPGHKDEVFAVDWSADGRRVASGGKDRVVRIWSS